MNDLGLDAIETQARYDFANGEYEIYGVAKVNAFRLVKRFFGR